MSNGINWKSMSLMVSITPFDWHVSYYANLWSREVQFGPFSFFVCW